MLTPLRRSGLLFDLVGLGEISVDDVLLLDRAPPWGGKARVKRRVRIGGGQVATAMVAARRLGLATAMIGVVGGDAVGAEAVAGLASEGVDIGGVVRDPRIEASHQAVIVVEASGERTVLWSESEQAAGGALDADPAAVTAGRVLHVDGNHLQAATRAAGLARVAGCLVSCDLDRYEGPRTDALLRLTDLCIVSAPFLAAFVGLDAGAPLAGEAAAAALPRLAERLPRRALACVTLGAHGCAASDDGALFVEPACSPPAPIVDTTACGDTFRAAFLAALLDGSAGATDVDGVAGAGAAGDASGAANLRRCLRFANAAAALKTAEIGRQGCPGRDRVERFLRSGT